MNTPRTVYRVLDAPPYVRFPLLQRTEFSHLRAGDRFVMYEDDTVPNFPAPVQSLDEAVGQKILDEAVGQKIWTALSDAYPFLRVVLDNGVTMDFPENFAVDTV